MTSPSEQRDLNTVQRWLQTVITHPDGAEAGIDSDEAQRIIGLKRRDLEQVVCRSRNLTAEQRIGIYANAYYARLLECLRESFPALVRALGREVFDEFAFEYLQRFPSTSYTLGHLGDHFADFLRQTRPDQPAEGPVRAVAWPDFLIDLATLEWNIEQVFDGPGMEGCRALHTEDIRAIPRDDWPQARLTLAPCVKLLAFRYPVSSYYTAFQQAREGEVIPLPEARPEHVCLTRRDFVVRRIILSQPQYEVLSALQRGQDVATAVAAAGDHQEDLSGEVLAQMIRRWFADWAAIGLFAEIKS